MTPSHRTMLRLLVAVAVTAWAVATLAAYAAGTPEPGRMFLTWSLPAFLAGVGARDLAGFVVYARSHDSADR